MFTGIVEEKGRVKGIAKAPHGYSLTVESKIVSKDVRIGDSVSVNGICLTVVKKQAGAIVFDVMEETKQRTNFTELSAGKDINLERPLKAGDKISGHFVTGHVDCVAKI
ncbi:MAG: riboflavin synthase, partial [Candidatus Omnitrophota bacterium]